MNFPFAAPEIIPATGAQLTAGITVRNLLTRIEASLTAAAALNVLPAADLREGATLILDITSDTTARDVTPTAGFLSGTPVAAGVISKRRLTTYTYRNGAFQLQSATITIN
jgi:hypothetical protein